MLHKAKTNKPDDRKQSQIKAFDQKAPSFSGIHSAFSGVVQSSNPHTERDFVQNRGFCKSEIYLKSSLVFDTESVAGRAYLLHQDPCVPAPTPGWRTAHQLWTPGSPRQRSPPPVLPANSLYPSAQPAQLHSAQHSKSSAAKWVMNGSAVPFSTVLKLYKPIPLPQWHYAWMIMFAGSWTIAAALTGWLTDDIVNTHNMMCAPVLLLHMWLLYILLISSMLIYNIPSETTARGCRSTSLPNALSLILDLPLSIFLCLKGFCERPGMKGCPQWERDCRDSAGGLRYQNCSLRVTLPERHSTPLSTVSAKLERCSL